MFKKFLPRIRVVNEIMWKSTVELGRPQMAIQASHVSGEMNLACLIPKARIHTNRHTHTLI